MKEINDRRREVEAENMARQSRLSELLDKKQKFPMKSGTTVNSRGRLVKIRPPSEEALPRTLSTVLFRVKPLARRRRE